MKISAVKKLVQSIGHLIKLQGAYVFEKLN